TVEYARMHGMKVSPVCPFAKAVFDKKPDFGDVLV
ncbi:MAG: GNAT family N-acetyltransferase, partial [Chitinophagaceae bacterium]